MKYKQPTPFASTGGKPKEKQPKSMSVTPKGVKPKSTMMAKGGVVAKAPAKGKAKPRKYAEGGDTMLPPAAPPSQAMQQQAMQQQARQQQAPMGRLQPQDGMNRMQRLGNRMQQTVESMPAYQQREALIKQFGPTPPTAAQLAQMQQYDQQIQTNPQFMRLQGKMQDVQQRQMPRQTTGTVGTAMPGSRVARQATSQPQQTPAQMAEMKAALAAANARQQQASTSQPQMAKGGMVKKKPATKPMTKTAKGGVVKKSPTAKPMTKKK